MPPIRKTQPTIGSLRDRINVYEKTSPGIYLDERERSVFPKFLENIPAYVVPFGGYRSFDGHNWSTVGTHRLFIRYNPRYEISYDHHIEWLGEFYEVLSVEDVSHKRRYLMITIRKRGPANNGVAFLP